MHHNHRSLLLAVIASVIGCGTTYAADYTYDVSFTIGTDVVTGQIVTDCDSCPLEGPGGVNNIVSYSLFDSNGTQDTSAANDPIVTGGTSPLSATPTLITYTASTANSSFTEFGYGAGASPAEFNFFSYFNYNHQTPGTADYTGSQIDDSTMQQNYTNPTILTIATIAPVPLPSSVWLLLVGLVPVGFSQRQRLLKRVSDAGN
jgi:hypothetical protein